MKPVRSDGQIIEANYSVSGSWPHFAVTFESGDGKGRNTNYTDGVEAVLRRVAYLGGRLEGGRVSSSYGIKRAAAMGLDLQLVPDDFQFPLALSPDTDFSSLRKSLGRAGARIGKPPTGSGNTTKRITLELSVLGPAPIAPDLLEQLLARPTAGELQSEDGTGPPIMTTSPMELEALRIRFQHASPKTHEALSRRIERGAVGDKVKKAQRHKCQMCKALGQEAVTFLKPDGVPYVEAHHVVLVSTLAVGALSPRNVIAVCANHHREIHYGVCTVEDGGDDFIFSLAGKSIVVGKNAN